MFTIRYSLPEGIKIVDNFASCKPKHESSSDDMTCQAWSASFF